MIQKDICSLILTKKQRERTQRILKLPGNLEIEMNLIFQKCLRIKNIKQFYTQEKGFKPPLYSYKQDYEELENKISSSLQDLLQMRGENFKLLQSKKENSSLTEVDTSHGISLESKQLLSFSQQDGEYNDGLEELEEEVSGVATVQFLKKADVFEVSYLEGEGDPLNVESSIYQLDMIIFYLKFNVTSFIEKSFILRLINLLEQYSDALKEGKDFREEEKILNIQEFWIASLVAHSFLEQKRVLEQFSPTVQILDAQQKKKYFSYEILKRTNYGFSSERKGISQDFANLLEISYDTFAFKCLRNGFPNYFTGESFQEMIKLHIEIRLAVLKNQNVSSFKNKKLIVTILTANSLRITCELQTELQQISFFDNPQANHLLLIFNLYPLLQEEIKEHDALNVKQSSLTSIQSSFYQSHSSELPYYERVTQSFLKNYYPQNQ